MNVLNGTSLGGLKWVQTNNVFYPKTAKRILSLSTTACLKVYKLLF